MLEYAQNKKHLATAKQLLRKNSACCLKIRQFLSHKLTYREAWPPSPPVHSSSLFKDPPTCTTSVLFEWPLTEALRNLEMSIHLCELYKLAKLIIVMPATNSTSEKTFSLLKLIKRYLRSTIRKGRLNHLMILSAYRNRLDEMNLRKVASIFV